MDTVFRYILIGVGVYAVATLAIKVFAFYWKANYEDRKKRREAEKNEKLKWKYCRVTLDNPLLNEIINNSHFSVFSGVPGAGKTLFMILLAKFCADKRYFLIQKNKREYYYMRPDILDQEQKLDNAKLLPVYSDLKIKDELAYKNDELGAYLFQFKKAIQYPVFLIDEIGDVFGKQLIYDQESKGAQEVLSSVFRYIRHDLQGHVFATEQDGQNIFLGIRRIGYSTIHCLKTIKKLTPIGQFKLKLFNFLNRWLPGIFTANLTRVMLYKFDRKDKIKAFFKLLFLPTYWAEPVEFYTRKKEIFNKIKHKYYRFNILFQYNNGEYYITFTFADIYQYDTREHKKKYDAMFDKDGNRKKIILEDNEEAENDN